MLNESLSETERSNCDPIPLCGLIENLIVYLKNLIVTESLSEAEGVIERFLPNSMETQGNYKSKGNKTNSELGIENAKEPHCFGNEGNISNV